MENQFSFPGSNLKPGKKLANKYSLKPLDLEFDECVITAFEYYVRVSPASAAITFGDETLTYADINERANSLAHLLLKRNVPSGSPVGIFLDRSFDYAISILGILKAGCVVVPLDIGYPEERLGAVLKSANIANIVTSEGLKIRLPSTGLNIFSLDLSIRNDSWEKNFHVDIAADAPAFTIFTSGSTGTPKGVVISRRNLGHFVKSVANRAMIGRQDVYLHVAPFNFIIGVRQLLVPLSKGAEVVLSSSLECSSPASTLELIERRNVSILCGVASFLSSFFEFLDIEQQNKTALLKSRLRMVLSGGEPLPVLAALKWTAHLNESVKIVSFYGQTETAGAVCSFELDRHSLPSDLDNANLPIGIPMPGNDTYLLDENMRPAATGAVGELYIAGPGISPGYIGNLVESNEKFTSIAVGSDSFLRVCRTGDRARILSDGNIVFVGRNDQLVKIRGIRVNPLEVECVLERHPDVREGIVVAKTMSSGEQRLCGYAIVKDVSVTAKELKRFLADRLPSYLVPPVICVVDVLPRNANGKKDRLKLATLNQFKEKGFSAVHSNGMTAENRLREIFAEVLEVEYVSHDDNFFDLGGNSLNAVRLIARISSVFRVALPISTLKDTATVSGLAKVIEKCEAGYSKIQTVHIETNLEDRFQPFPLNDIQGAYFLSRSAGFANQAAHRYMEIESRDLDLRRFEKAWNIVLRRHDMLRATILPDGTQRIAAEVPVYEVRSFDLTELTAKDEELALTTARERLSHQIFQPNQWPMFEIIAHRLRSGITRLHFSIDFLICDGKSWRVLLHELAKFYEDANLELPSLGLSFRDVVLARNAHKKSARYQESLKYWMERLTTMPPAPILPISAPNESNQGAPGFVRRHAVLPKGLWDILQQHAARVRVTPSSVLVTAYAEILATWAKSSRFTINLTALNRPPWHDEINDLVGDFTSITLLSFDLSTTLTFEKRVIKTQYQLWQDLDHQDVDGIVLLRELVRRQPENASGGIMPIVFTSMLNIHASSGGELNNAIRSEYVYRLTQTPQLWIDHTLFEENGALNLNWDSVEGLFPRGMLNDMFDAYVARLKSLASEPESWTSVTNLLPRAQLQRRREINETSGAVSKESLFSLFSKQADSDLARTAIISARKSMTYGELRDAANGIAQVLQQGGAKRGDVVAIVMEKGWEQIASVLGILQIGCAYLPVDATFPSERIKYLIEHSNAVLVTTQTKWRDGLSWLDSSKLFSVADSIPENSSRIIEHQAEPDDLAYILYTSGSTGQPKGVAMPHRGPVNTVLDINERFGVNSSDRVIALSALNFDLSVYDIFGALSAGAALVIPDPEGIKDPAHWYQHLIKDCVTVWNSVPALMRILVDYVDSQSTPEKISSLRLVLQSGDWIPVTLPDQIRRIASSARVIGAGGPTETSIWSSCYPIEVVDPTWKSIPYGKPLKNQTCHILNEMFEPCPVWVPGEIYIGGRGLANGYWNDKTKTDAHFISHPVTGERLYKSGDLGRYMDDGNVEFLGREDFQVKLRGYRIELGEIEAALEKNLRVRQAVVVLKEVAREKFLEAYFVPRESPASLSDLDRELRLFLRQHIPEYMMPSKISALDKLPLSANGKVDRGALRALKSSDPNTVATGDATFSSLELQVAQQFATLLDLPLVETDRNFFDLGGDSVRLIQLQRLINKSMKISIPIAILFKLPTPRQLAKHIAGLQAGSNLAVPKIPSTDYETSVSRLGDLIDLKMQEPGIRRDVDEKDFVQFMMPKVDPAFAENYSRRMSHRRFLPEIIAQSDFANLLSCFLQIKMNGFILPKYRYPSAGNIYPVQIYVYVKPNRVEGVAPGAYYYHPKDHRLVRLSSDVNSVTGENYFEKNRPVFDDSAFSVFMIANMLPVISVYGEQCRDFCLLEAGSMTQLLMETCQEYGIGICPVGRMQSETLRPFLQLAPSDVVVFSLLGGKIKPENRPSENESSWLKSFNKNSTVRRRIFCFHNAGASAQIFDSWQERVEPDVEICAVQLPGRAERSHEQPLSDMRALANEIRKAMKGKLDCPYALVGFSFGATVAFEVCRQLRVNYDSAPEHLVVIAGRPPSLAQPTPWLHELPDKKFLELMNERLVGTLSPELLNSTDVQELVMPTLRADMKALERYAYEFEKPFSFPITAFGGERDPLFTRDVLENWRQQTSSTFSIQTYPGVHFFAGTRNESTAMEKFLNALSPFLRGPR